jgi:hypothetical protein
MNEIDENMSDLEKREEFITIDDLLKLSEILYKGMINLSQQRHPLFIRKGVGEMQVESKNEVLKTGSKTYFFDIETAQNGKPYLKITESYLTGETKEQVRNTIIIFQEDVFKFSGFVNVMAKKIG